jgi:glutamine amidotransferase
MKEVTVVDHGLCNLFNLSCALEEVGVKVVVARDARAVAKAQSLILPGVGAFEPAMDTLCKMDLIKPIQEYAASGKPLLGICLGMQLLMDESQENGQHKGLGLIRGGATRFELLEAGPGTDKVPQISWNTLQRNAALPHGWNDPLLNGIPEGVAVYFVHSYYVATADVEDTLAYSTYAGTRYSAIVHRKNVWGAQFHPERSARFGLKLLSNFAQMT